MISTGEDKLRDLLVAANTMEWRVESDKDAPSNASPTAKDQFRNWFLQQFKRDGCCQLDNFAIYFLNMIRQCTEQYLRSNEIEPTPHTSMKTIKSSSAETHSSVSDIRINKYVESNTPKRLTLCLQNSTPPPTPPHLASTPEQLSKNKSGYLESSTGGEDISTTSLRGTPKNISYGNPAIPASQSLDQSITSTSFKNNITAISTPTSTPIRRNQHNNNNSRRSGGGGSLTLPVASHSSEKTTPRNQGGPSSSSFCLGDFIVLQQQNNSRSNRSKKTTHGEATPNTKPKRRVVPTTISQKTTVVAIDGDGTGGDLKPFGSSSSFSNENNILKLATVEIEDKNKCSIMAARKSLKLNAIEISKELKTSAAGSGDNEKGLRDLIERKLLDVTAKSEVVGNAGNENTNATPLNKEFPAVASEKVKNASTIQFLADIYVVLMDLNYITNILSEMAFVLNLLNARETGAVAVVKKGGRKMEEEANITATTGPQILSNATNCIYFALCVLRRQRHLFAQLDHKSLGVVLHNERIQYLDADFKSHLEAIHQHKQSVLLGKLPSSSDGSAWDAFVSSATDQSFKSVYYQEHKDSRQHFTSNNEFGAFKTQRDLFYKTLKLWETHHLNPSWNFSQELTPKIREIFKQSENPINMAHFAKLFVSQLLISASDAASPEDIGLDVDAEKFSKLAQRLVAPSNFSVDYQFPRNQAFFRDFLAEARSIAFIEQLKMALYQKLITLNSSTFEQFNLCNGCASEADEFEMAENDEKRQMSSEYVARPDILASMIILAKFLGLIMAYPFNQNGMSSMSSSTAAPVMSGNIEKKQLVLRSLFLPPFSIFDHLLDAVKSNKMLITLPWLVQYLAMLDNVTLQLEDYEKTIQLLFTIYTKIGIHSAASNTPSPTTAPTMLPTSLFMLRCCMGWLFDTKPLIAEKYFNYRPSSNLKVEITKIAVKEEVQTHSVIQSPKPAGNNHHVNSVSSYSNVEEEISSFNPLLECLLPVACPFLAEFRVAIMPSKYATTKYLSRTGRYRHITTRIAEPPITHEIPTTSATKTTTTANLSLHSLHNNTSLNTTINSEQMLQNKLTEAFLHSQNASMRRLIEFTTERVYKSVVRDGQHKFIVPIKAAADERVNEITSSNVEIVARMVSAIYKRAHEDALEQWELNMPPQLDERIRNALTSLLPAETTTSPVIKRIYAKLIRQNATKRIRQWLNDNLRENNLLCGDLNEITEKICKANNKKGKKLAKSATTTTLSELKIVQMQPCISDMLDELQYWLHCTSLRTELLGGTLATRRDTLVAFLQHIPETFPNTLPTIFYHIIGTGTVQLMQHLILHMPEWLTNELLESACAIWLNPTFKTFIQSDEKNNQKNNKLDTEKVETNDNGSMFDYSSFLDNQRTPSIYDGLITVEFIEALDGMRCGKLKDLLVFLLAKKILTLERINLLLQPILKLANCSTNVLDEISKVLQVIDEGGVVQGQGYIQDNIDSAEDEGKKTNLFLEEMGDISRDMDSLSIH